MAVEAVLTREVVSTVACPGCGELLTMQEMAVHTRPMTEGGWVVARRLCPRGCLLLGVEIPQPRDPVAR